MTQPRLTPVEMLEKLVGFDTVSSKSNLALIDFVTDYLAEFGVTAELVPNAEGTKANLWATVGPQVRGGVCLSGHTDVVPVEGQDWSSDPFILRTAEGRLFGRGTCDMKGFVATALALLPEMTAAPLKRPIHFALSYDEEVNCLGAPDMIARIGGHFPQPSVVIVGEPSMMQVVSAHKGCWGLQITVRGKEAHSSLYNQGVSAVMNAARLVAKLDDMTRARAAAADPDCGFDPPYTTLHVGMINGGTAGNIIARECAFPVDIRYLPEDFPEDIVEEFTDWYGREVVPGMQGIAPESGIDVEIINRTPGLRADLDSEAEQFARMLTGDNERRQVSYCTEAGYFQEAGIATVICGPGDIAQAHKPDEFITLGQMAACESFLQKLIARCRA